VHRAPSLAGAAILVALCTLAPAAPAQDVSAGFDATLFGEQQILSAVAPHHAPATGDLNEDGRDDLVVNGTSLTTFELFLGQAGGGVAAAGEVPLWADILGGRLYVQDVDGDGHLDVLANRSDEVSFVRGHGDGSFEPFVASGLSEFAHDIAVGDVDGDGLVDVVAASLALDWMQGHGDGTFGPSHAIAASLAGPEQLGLADVDADGRLDILQIEFITEPWTNVVKVRRGLGGGAFAPPTQWSSDAHLALRAADVDGDGRLDLVHGTYAGVVRVLRGLGDATFEAPVDVDLGPDLAYVTAVDLDRDGFADLVGGRSTPPALVAQRMGPAGPVGPPHIEVVALELLEQELATGDFDGDGQRELVASSSGFHQVAVIGNALGPFIELGHELSSPEGTPSLQLSGTPVPNQLVTVQASGPSATGLLLFGLQPANVPLAGGFLVPDVALVVPVGPTVSFTARWPAGLTVGTTLYVQAWYLVPGGAAASNAWVAISE
jgi:hypothetical protein